MVPKGGANIAGRFVPEGVIVSVAQWPTYHSTRNFSQPFSFQPERFLQPGKYPDDKPGAIQPFGIGPRDCIGKKWVFYSTSLPDDVHGKLCTVFQLGERLLNVLSADVFSSLAYAEVKLTVTRILYNFDMELVNPDEDWMKQKAFFIWTKPPLNVYLTHVRQQIQIHGNGSRDVNPDEAALIHRN